MGAVSFLWIDLEKPYESQLTDLPCQPRVNASIMPRMFHPSSSYTLTSNQSAKARYSSGRILGVMF